MSTNGSASAGYYEPPVEREPDELAEAAYDYLAQQVPGWEPAGGNLDTLLIEVTSRMGSDLRALAADVPESIFRTYGSELVNIPPEPAGYATVGIQFTAMDTHGYVIPAGTAVGVRRPDGNLEAFGVQADLTIAAAATTVIDTLVAIEAGAQANGLVAGSEAQMLDALAFVQAVAVTTASDGGADAETDDDYLDRLADELRLLAPRPILPDDFAVLARRDASVARALAVNLYDPGPPVVLTQERCVSLAMVTAAGEPVDAATKTRVDAALQAQREVNFKVFEIDPTYTTIDARWQVAFLPGYTAAGVDALVTSALQAYFAPAAWGLPPTGDDPDGWREQLHVRWSEVVVVVNTVEGVDYIVTLTIAKGGQAQATADLTLTGPAALTRPGSIQPSTAAIPGVP